MKRSNKNPPASIRRIEDLSQERIQVMTRAGLFRCSVLKPDCAEHPKYEMYRPDHQMHSLFCEAHGRYFCRQYRIAVPMDPAVMLDAMKASLRSVNQRNRLQPEIIEAYRRIMAKFGGDSRENRDKTVDALLTEVYDKQAAPEFRKGLNPENEIKCFRQAAREVMCEILDSEFGAIE